MTTFNPRPPAPQMDRKRGAVPRGLGVSGRGSLSGLAPDPSTHASLVLGTGRCEAVSPRGAHALGFNDPSGGAARRTRPSDALTAAPPSIRSGEGDGSPPGLISPVTRVRFSPPLLQDR